MKRYHDCDSSYKGKHLTRGSPSQGVNSCSSWWETDRHGTEAIAVSFTAWSEAESNSGPGIGFWNLKAHLSNIPAVTRPHLLQSGHASQSFSNSFTHWNQAFKHISLWKPLPFRLPHLGSWTEYEGESKLSTQYSSLSAFWQETQYNQLHGLPRTMSSPWRLSVLCNCELK